MCDVVMRNLQPCERHFIEQSRDAAYIEEEETPDPAQQWPVNRG